MRAVLVATGYRKEMEPLVQYKPTPLFKIVDKPILFHIIESLVKSGVRHYDIILNHLPQSIEESLRDGKRWGITLTFHLARHSEFPYDCLRPIASAWGDETILLGTGDTLPHFDNHNLQKIPEHLPHMFFYPSKKWSGWGFVKAASLAQLPAEVSESDLLEKLVPKYRTGKAHPHFSSQTFRDLAQANFRFLSHADRTELMPSSAYQVEPGVWISHAASLHPSVKVAPPVYIGEHCEIKNDVFLGPNAVVESHCIVDCGSLVERSVICQTSFVGEGLQVLESIVDRNLLINLKHETALVVQDDFILSGLSPPHFLTYVFHWVERMIAGLLLVLLFPIYLYMKAPCKCIDTEMLMLPAPRDRLQWQTFNWKTFVPKENASSKRWTQLFHNLPTLINIFRGEVHFIGVSPRTLSEVETLPHDWQQLYRQSKVGLITLAALNHSQETTSDDLYASETYYAIHMGFWFDMQLLLRWMMDKIGVKRKR